MAAAGLVARSKRGPIFGPVDLTLQARDLCIVHGPRGSGKSALLLALTGRFRGATGHLTICGVDAMTRPRAAMAHTSIARLGDYVAPEDRLTVAESIEERAYLEGIRPARARARFDELEELLGLRMDRSLELEHLTTLERSLVSVLLVMIRPTEVIALDDADLRLARADQGVLFEWLTTLLAVDDATLIASAVDAAAAPAGSVIMEMPRTTPELNPTPLVPTGGGQRAGAERPGDHAAHRGGPVAAERPADPARAGSPAASASADSSAARDTDEIPDSAAEFWPWPDAAHRREGAAAHAVRRPEQPPQTRPDEPSPARPSHEGGQE